MKFAYEYSVVIIYYSFNLINVNFRELYYLKASLLWKCK